VDGGLQVRGPELFVGYLEAAQTAEAMTEDGWYRTGDLARIDEAGWLQITGRAKDIIIRAGENVSIGEVEGALLAHPDITAASVVGIPHERLGEQVAAAVVTNGRSFSLEECRTWFDRRGITRFKTPEVVVVVDALPRLPTGKVDAGAVRSMVEQR
jgi:non-ribosomal peptide synthetase component E (peptide arylation enzyme)